MTASIPRPPRGPIDPPDSPGWRKRAACRNADPELFFPDIPSGPSTAERWQRPAVLRVKANYCGRCPVIYECRETALAIPGVAGIWGGLSQEELRLARRQRLRQTREEEGAAR